MIEALKEMFMWLWEWVLCITLNLMASLLHFIPVPDAVIEGLSTGFDNSNSMLSYFAGFLRLDFAIVVFFAAAVTRFIIRRLPIIG